MTVLDVGAEVVLLRFLPDGWRLVVGLLGADQQVRLEIVAVGDGTRISVEVPPISLGYSWSLCYRNWLAISPSAEMAYVVWDEEVRSFSTVDGRARELSIACPGSQILLSPSGSHLLVNGLPHPSHTTAAWIAVSEAGERLEGYPPFSATIRRVIGFLRDGSGLVTIEDPNRLCVRPAIDEEPVVSVRYPSHHVMHPRISPDGRFVGIIGYHSMYVYDLPTPGKPRRISGSRSSGDFYGFAFHPNGRSIAVIHGGPTLVKEYTLPDLAPLRKRNWKVGPLRAIDYSPDGTMGAAGGRDGRIVVWDADD